MLKTFPQGPDIGENRSYDDFKKNLASTLNEAGAREVDGRRFSSSSADKFWAIHYSDAKRGPQVTYDDYFTRDHQILGLEKELIEQIVSGKYVPPKLPKRNAVVPSTEYKPWAQGVNKAGQKLIEQAVAFINEKANETVYKGSVEIGNYLLDKFFDGDIAKASSKSRAKLLNYRALCNHPDLAASPGTLSVMLRVAAQEKLFKENNLPVNKLSYSHKAELLKVSDEKLKIKIFKRAVKQGFSVRDLQIKIDWEKNPDSKNKSKGKINEFQRFLDRNLLDNEVWLRKIDAKRRKKLQAKVELVYMQLTKLLDDYTRARALLSDIENGNSEEIIDITEN